MNAVYALDLKAYQPDTTYVPRKPKITKAEYWEKYYDYPDVTYEWNNGELEEKGVSDFVTISMADWFNKLLGYFLETHPLAKKTFLKFGFSLTLDQKKKIRRPDFGIVLNTNPIPLLPSDKSYQGIFDLCIEVLSDSKPEDIKRDTEDKWIKYAKGGVKEYYILDGQDRYTAFYCLNKRGFYVPINPLKGGIIQSTALPGFQFRLVDLLKRPLQDEMIDDPVYQSFVLPGYSKEKRARQHAEQQAETEKMARQHAEQQAQEAKQQAETEKMARQHAEQQAQKAKQQAETEKMARQHVEQQAQEAKQYAEQLAQKLRALGIDPDDI